MTSNYVYEYENSEGSLESLTVPVVANLEISALEIWYSYCEHANMSPNCLIAIHGLSREDK